MKTQTSIQSAALLSCAVLIAGCSTATANPTEQTASSNTAVETATGVRVVTAETRLAAELLQATGTVYSRREATLAAQTGGVMSQLLVQVGDRVKKGQALARLDPTSAAIAVAQANAAKAAAEATLDGAKMEAARMRKLGATGSVPGATLAPEWALDATSFTLNAKAPSGADEPTKTKTNMEPKKILLKLLNLADDATDAQIEAAAVALSARLAAIPEAAALTALATSNTALTVRLDAAEKDRLLMGARMDGKVVALSADVIGKLSVADVKAHVDALPKGAVPLAAQTPGNVTEPGTLTKQAAREALAALPPAEQQAYYLKNKAVIDG